MQPRRSSPGARELSLALQAARARRARAEPQPGSAPLPGSGGEQAGWGWAASSSQSRARKKKKNPPPYIGAGDTHTYTRAHTHARTHTQPLPNLRGELGSGSQGLPLTPGLPGAEAESPQAPGSHSNPLPTARCLGGPRRDGLPELLKIIICVFFF